MGRPCTGSSGATRSTRPTRPTRATGSACSGRSPARRSGLTWAATAAATAALALLAGCATAPPAEPGARFSGRLLVRTEATATTAARSDSGQFELSGTARRGQLSLLSPLGTVVARANWRLGERGTPDEVLLDTSGPGGPRHYATLDDLLLDTLGQALPVAALFDWLAGRPWPGAAAEPLPGSAATPPAPSTPSTPAPPPAPTGFRQLGWDVDLTGFAGDRRVEARRADPPPAVRVRVKLDDPADNPG